MQPAFYMVLGIISSFSAGGMVILAYCGRMWQKVTGAVLAILGMAGLLMIMEVFSALNASGVFD